MLGKYMVFGLATAVSACASLAPAAVLVDFSNYIVNSDLGSASNPSPNWSNSGSAGQFEIADGVGTGGSRGTVSSTTASQNASVVFRPADSLMGAAFTAPGTPRAEFAFDVKLQTASATAGNYRLFILNTSSATRVASFNVFNDGDIGINGAKKAGLLDNLLSDGQYHHFWGDADWGTGKYNLYTTVAGNTVAVSSNANFEAPTTAWTEATPTKRYGGFQLNVQTTAAATHRVAFDNFYLSVPEPASAGALAMAGSVLCLRRRRQS